MDSTPALIGFLGVVIGSAITGAVHVVAARHERRSRYVDSLRMAYSSWASDFKTTLALQGETKASMYRASMYGDAQGAAIEGHQRRFQDAISAVGRSQYALLLLEEEAARRTSILRLNQKLMLLPPTEDGTGLASELDKFLMELIDQQALFPEREL